MSKTVFATLNVGWEGDERIAVLEIGGKWIAKRYSGRSWIILEPGYSVHGGEPGNYDQIVVEYHGEGTRPQ
jgi:hypothetical protein